LCKCNKKLLFFSTRNFFHFFRSHFCFFSWSQHRFRLFRQIWVNLFIFIHFCYFFPFLYSDVKKSRKRAQKSTVFSLHLITD
jgi:hypothetical protein